MKREGTKKVRRKKRRDKDVWGRKIKLLIIILIILLLVLIILYLIEIYKPVKEVELEGELGALKFWHVENLPEGLVSWWEFEGNADDSIGNNHGSLENGSTIILDNDKGNVLRLDGDGDYVDCGNDNSLNITDEITISAWVYLLDQSDSYPGIVWKEDVFMLRYSPLIPEGESFQMFFNNGSEGPSNPWGPGVQSDPYTDERRWYHVVGTYDKDGGADNLRIYIDGQLEDQDTRTGAINSSTGNVYIGAYASVHFFNGSIDDVMIFNRALNETEVMELYSGFTNATLTQISLIENISFYKDDSRLSLINLNDYFSCLGDISYSFVESPSNAMIEIEINETGNLNIIALDGGWFSFQKFNLTASCDEEILDVSSEGSNMTFYVIAINGTRPVTVENDAPEFLDDDCEYFSFYVNTTYTMDMDDCFEDEDGPEDLEFRYTNMSIDNISIEEHSGDRLEFIPEQNFIGKGYFYIYANDSIEEVRSDKIYVDVKVRNVTNVTTNVTNITQNVTQNVTLPQPPRILSSTSGTNFQFSPREEQSFFVNAENYDVIEWYLDNRLVKIGGSYTLSNLSAGNYTVKAEVKKGAEVVSRTWSLSIVEEEVARRGSVYIIIICCVLGILILLVVLLIIKNVIDKKERARAKPIIQSGPRPRPKPRLRIGQRLGLRRRPGLMQRPGFYRPQKRIR